MKKNNIPKQVLHYVLSANTTDPLSDRTEALSQNRQNFFKRRANTRHVLRIGCSVDTMINIAVLILFVIAIGEHIWS